MSNFQLAIGNDDCFRKNAPECMQWMKGFIADCQLPIANWRFAIGIGLLGVLLACGGCFTAPKAPLFTADGPGWRVQEGQALWRPKRDFPELAGELVVARDDDGRCMIQFAKTPLALVLAQTTRTKWRIEFPPRRMRFGGTQPPPSQLAFTWLYLPAALSGQPLPDRFHFEHKADGGWRLENTRSGESLEGFLSP